MGRRYRILSEIGSGGMGTVFRARHVLVGREVAVKLMTGRVARDPVWRERLLREAQTSNLLEHENIVDIIDFGDDGEALYLVMELLEGESLATRLERGTLPPRETLDVALSVTSALARAHQFDVVHRDIKPGNIFLCRTPHGLRVKVLDFGIARVLGAARLTETGAVLGTPEYMSPEQSIGGEVGPASDLYSLGVVLFEALTGRLPFLASGARLLVAHAFEKPPRLGEVAPQVAPDLAAIVDRLLEKVPSARFPDAHALRDALLTVRASMTPLAVGPPSFVLSSAEAFCDRADALDAAIRTRFGDAPPPEIAALRAELRATLHALERSMEEGSGVVRALDASDEQHRSTIARIGGALDVLAHDASVLRSRLDEARARERAAAHPFEAAAARAAIQTLEAEAADLTFQIQTLRARMEAVEAEARAARAAHGPRANALAEQVLTAQDNFETLAETLARAIARGEVKTP